MYVPQDIENAMADAKRRRRTTPASTLFDFDPQAKESEFGKPAGEVSPPTPGRHVPPAPGRISVSHVGPGPGVGR